MFGSFRSSSRGAAMIILHILRAFGIVALAASVVSFWVLILNIEKKRQWFVFEGASLFFLSCLPIFLIISEFPIFGFVKNYFLRVWPAVGPEAGLGWLGTGMVVIGCNLLGKLNQAAFDEKNMGDSFRQLVLASGILNLIFGAVNVMCTFLWGDRKNNITARDVRSKGSLAESKSDFLPKYSSDDYASTTHSSSRKEKTRSKFMTMFWKDNERPVVGDRPIISAPMAVHDYEQSDGEDRASPIMPGIKRPDTALHPMHTRTSSRYSEANLSRF